MYIHVLYTAAVHGSLTSRLSMYTTQYTANFGQFSVISQYYYNHDIVSTVCMLASLS